MNYPEELRTVAERVMWFEGAEETLRYPKRFLAYLMTFGTLEEILTAKKYFSDQNFEEVLTDPPAGIFDERSWSYWNGVYKRNPPPPLPRRTIPGQTIRS
jgi:hypothetical protein